MKDIKTYITESQSNVQNLGFSKEELLEDFNLVQSADTATKKELSQKYKINTKRAKEIEIAILDQFRILRSEAKTFDDTDLRMFGRYDGAIKKLVTLEGINFLLYYKDRLWQKIEDQKLTKKISFTKIRDWNYYMTGSQKHLIDTYLAVVAEIDSRDESKISAKNEKEQILDGIILELMSQTKDFHDDFINDAKSYASRVYDNAPNVIKTCDEKLPALREERDEIVKTLRKEYGIRYYYRPEYTEIDKKVSNLEKKRSTAKALLRKSKTEFISEVEKNAEETFNRNIKSLAEKIMVKDFDFSSFKVTSISNDPKYFELLITDGKSNLYARSIYAAEYSDKMVPHFRFIITNKRK